MAEIGTNIPISGLARRLVKEGFLNEEKAREAIVGAKRDKLSLVPYLVQHSLAKPKDIARCAAEEFGDPLIDLAAMSIDNLPKGLVDQNLLVKHHAVPLFKRGNRLYVAVSDPTNLQASEEIRFNTGLNVETIIAEEDKLNQLLESLVSEAEGSAFDELDEDLEDIDVSSGDDDKKPDDGGASGADDAPIVRFVNKLLLDAIKGGCSDLHFEPYEKTYRVRFRQDGILREVSRPPVNTTAKIAARLKVMAKLNIAERRVPQDGRIKMKISKTRSIDFRVNTCPTLWGEKIVLRILDAESAKMGIDALGYEDYQKALREFTH